VVALGMLANMKPVRGVIPQRRIRKGSGTKHD
jgi:hypothetical protein